MLTDLAELMDAGEAGNNGEVADGAVAAECGIVGENAVVADEAIVGDMGVGEEEVIVADAGGDLLGGATVDGGVLAEGIPVSDDQSGRLAVVFQVLGELTDGREGEKGVVLPDGGVAFDDDMGFKHAARADLDVGPYNAEGADLHVAGQLGSGVDDGSWVDHGVRWLSRWFPGFSALRLVRFSYRSRQT